MRLNKITLALLSATLFVASSCSDNDDSSDNSVVTPTSYTFERNGSSSVNYEGQSSRILMLNELGNYIKDQATTGDLIDVAVLNNMYTNVSNPFSTTALNTSEKQLRNKVAASRDYFVNLGGAGSTVEQTAVRNFFASQFNDANEASTGNVAAANVAGSYIDGSSVRLFAANGLEPQQILLKGMMGACFMDQIANHYLSTAVLDEGGSKIENTNKVLEAGKNYTSMEHKWDEAYGYIYGAGGSKFWDSYINQVNADSDFNTVKEAIEVAFRKGRAAIVANNYDVRDAQIAIIKSKIAMIPAVRAVYYLKSGKEKLVTDNGAKAFHALSEAYGFIMSLRYTQNPATNEPYMSKVQVDAILAELTAGTNGLWDVDYLNEKLDGIAAQIAAPFGFTVEQAQTVN
ncbi:DUF4856 domain-containing protein [Flavobacterium ardleyense]|uniref:DUF4856 domain-containing protein n=1 Tax=Flavobacterium ardleyense TaxID=2038737 RepID=A0ABW5Z9X8_9FLAO